MPLQPAPELSIIVPLLNESEELPYLFASLSEQRGINFELILSAADSGDEQQKVAAELASGCRFNTRYIKAQSGRGRQMNAGAEIARSALLLFLHADSRFLDPDAICRSVAYFREQTARKQTMLAAHFTLSFRRSYNSASLAYFYYEAKTNLNRPDCIRGDQGFMLGSIFFRLLGGLDESLPFLEDIRLVDAVDRQGEWLALPASVSTSARRFEKEGLCQRQIVNAIIVNAFVIGWEELFHSLPDLYRCHPESGQLQLFPLFDGIRKLIAKNPPAWQKKLWLATGQHVGSNVWQIFFWLDVRTAFIAGLRPEQVGNRWLRFYLQYLEPVCSSRPFAFLTAVAVWLWYRLLLLTKRRS